MKVSINQKEILGKIKLIVWDLDETFWKGTISDTEGILKDEYLHQNIKLVKQLSERGIVNSICSKNDRDEVEKCLKELEINEYFVFASVNWEPKGQRLGKVIQDMSLRPENVLFIDDNTGNLEEAEYYNSEIMVATPEIIDLLVQNVTVMGKDDMSLSRLKQYQLLEKKAQVKEKFSDNISFLVQSDIKVFIGKDCINKIDRIHELILRTNQLNYTKNRMDKQELEELLAEESVDAGYVMVYDRYGEYGLSGFYALKEGVCIHFLFSCRIMGMGIEQFIYDKIGMPELKIAEPVSGKVGKEVEVPAYIQEIREYKKAVQEDAKTEKNVLIKGPCDLQVMTSFLQEKGNVQEEFNYTDDSGQQVDFYNHAIHILNSGDCSKVQRKQICEKYSFIPESSFETELFEKKWDVVCISVLMDATLGVYEHVESGIKIPFGLYNVDMTQKCNWDRYLNKTVMTARSNFTREELENFSREFKKVEYSADDVAANLQRINKKILENNENAKCIIVLLSELPYESRLENKNVIQGKEKIHIEINQKVKYAFKDCSNVYLLDVNKYVKSQDDYFDNINHYSNLVYYHMAKEFSEFLMKMGKDGYKPISKVKAWFYNVKKIILKKFFLREYVN